MRRYPNPVWLCGVLLSLAIFCGAGSLRAEELAAALASEPALQGKIAELQSRLKGYGEAETASVAQALNVTLEQLRDRSEVLQETQNYYIQQLQALHKQESLRLEQAALQERIVTGAALKLAEAPPYSLNFYDEYNSRYGDSKRTLETAQLAVTMAEKGVRDGRERLAAAAAQLRVLLGAEGKGKEPRERARNQWLFQEGEREEALAAAALGYQEQVLANARVEAEVAGTVTDLARQVCERIRENLHFDQSDLDQQLAGIDAGREALQPRIEGLRRDLRRSGREVLAAQSRVAQAKGAGELAAAQAALAVAEEWQQTYRLTLEQNEAIMQQLGFRRQLWKQRYDLIKGEIKREELPKLREESLKQRDMLRQRVVLEQERQTTLQLRIGKLEEQLRQEKVNWGGQGILSDTRQALMEQVAGTIDFQTALNKTGQMNLQFLEELDRAHHAFSLAETVSLVFAKLKGWWSAELFVVDNQALTVSKLIIALAILTLGILMAGFFSSQLQKRLLGSLRVSTSSAAITSKLIHYSVVLVVIFLAMRLVNIPPGRLHLHGRRHRPGDRVRGPEADQ